MEKNNLGQIIHKTLQQFYPNTQLPIKSYEIQDILDKAKIDKRNSSKEEISKIIKILKHHIEIANQNKIQKVEPQEYKPLFTNMENDNSYLDKMRDDLEDNLKQIDINNNTKLPIQNKDISINSKSFEFSLIVDNKYRNAKKYPNPSDYSITFSNDIDADNEIFCNQNLNNIEEIELVECIINDDAFNANEYIILNIKELNTEFLSNNKFVRNCFTRLISFTVIEINKKKYHVYDIPKDSLKKFSPAINLNSISINLKNAIGEDLLFNRDDLGIEPLLNSFKFKIKTQKEDNYVSLI